jgi:putative peptide zinc metalloprotease protein
VLQPYGLAVLAEGLALVVAAGMLIAPLMGLVKLGRDPRWRGRFKMKRMAISGGVLLAIGAFVFLVPLPRRIVVPVVIGPADAQRVYVSVPGTVLEAASAGEQVQVGQSVGRLANLNLKLLVEQLQGQHDQQKRKLEHLDRRSKIDPAVLAEIPTAKEILTDLEKRLADRKQDLQRLHLCATRAGTVIPPPVRERPFYEENRLVTWCGSPLDAANRGCFMDTGSLFCLVGDPDQLEGRAVVSQADIQDVRPGQRVRIRLDQLPGKVISGDITEVSGKPLEVAPPELTGTGRLAVLVDQNGVSRPADQSYETRIELDDVANSLLIGTSGHAKIYAAPQTLGSRLLRMIKRTFHFEL